MVFGIVNQKIEFFQLFHKKKCNFISNLNDETNRIFFPVQTDFLLTIFFVKTHHSVLNFCHLTFFPEIMNLSTFEYVQMMLKRFFDISTGFRFPKVLCGSVPSIPVLSCP